MRQHEAVVQIVAPAHRRAFLRLAPEPRDQRAQQQLLRKAHARVGGHLERAELDEAEPAGRAIGRIELVDADLRAMGVAGDVGEQIAEQAVHHPQRRLVAWRRRLRERDLQLVKLIVARLVEPRRLTGRADEEAGEQKRKRGMALPVKNEAREQIGSAQDRRIRRRRAAQHDMIAAARPGVPPVGHELVRAEPREPRFLI